MAHSTLPVLSASTFPQVLKSAIDQLVARIAARPELGSCDFTTEYDDCHAAAVVHDLGRDQEFCVRHFLAVNRGR